MLGHIRCYRRTGNNRAKVLSGLILVSLTIFLALWPRGNAHKANIWLYRAGGGPVKRRPPKTANVCSFCIFLGDRQYVDST